MGLTFQANIAAGTQKSNGTWQSNLKTANLNPIDTTASSPPPELRTAVFRARQDLSAVDSRNESGTEIPTPLVPLKKEVTEKNGIFLFKLKGKLDTITFQFEPDKGFPDGLSLVKNRRLVNKGKKLFGMSFTYNKNIVKTTDRQSEDETVGPEKYNKGKMKPNNREFTAKLLSAKKQGPVVKCVYRYTSKKDNKVFFDLAINLKLERGSLLAEISNGKPGLTQLLLKVNSGDTIFYEYYVGDFPRYFPASNVFIGLFTLRDLSNAAKLPRNGAVYPPLTDGSHLPFRETFCITASRYPESLFPNTPYQASPYRRELQNRIVMDLWEGDFKNQQLWLRKLREYGLDSLLVIAHIWQNLGFDRTNPNMLPANAGLGGDKDLAALAQTARKLGHRFCIHENYYDIVPGNPDYHKSFLAKNPDGSYVPRLGGHGQFVKPSRHMDYVKKFSTDAGRRYGCNSCFHDVMPHTKVDYEAGQPGAGLVRRSFEYQTEYFAFVRKLYKGPAVTEMIDSRFAGAWDSGCNAYMNNMLNRKPLSAYEWLKVRPKTQNHGAGYYERWSPWGYRPGWDRMVLTPRELDRYRAMELAFGRVGFIGRQVKNASYIAAAVKEYYLMRAVQAAIDDSKVKTINYYINRKGWNGWVDAAGAARFKQFARLRITFVNGTELLVNYNEKPWKLQGITLPGWGFVCRGKNGFAYTALRNGQIVDYAEFGNNIYLDARSGIWTPPEPPPALSPQLGAWKDLGNGDFELTVIWRPQRILEHDFNSFWEFKDAGTTKSRPVFLNSHKMKSPPTSTWKIGGVYYDGPHRLKLAGKTKEYDLVLGLTHPTGKAMRPLVYHTMNKVRIAKLFVKRDKNGKVISLKFTDAKPVMPPGSDPKEYYVGMNVNGQSIDFGGIITDGSAILKKDSGKIEITPVPLNSSIKLEIKSRPAKITALSKNGTSILKAVPRADRYVINIPENTQKVIILQ